MHMGQSVFDNFLVCDNFASKKMSEIFSEKNTIQEWLTVEAALAKAQADLGIIPAEAAEHIAATADVDRLDLTELQTRSRDTGHPFLPALRVFTELCGQYGGYVHWGATTQDILDTALILQLARSRREISHSLSALVCLLEEKAWQYRNTIMMGRTNGQQALPITLGFKYAVWLAELKRHGDRLTELEPRLLTGQFSGAVGTLASLGKDGIAVAKKLCEHLGLQAPAITWNTSRDTLAEYTSVLGLITSTLGKMGNEVYALQKQEFGELEENAFTNQVGSSTMPHKKNPFLAMQIVTLGRMAGPIVAQAYGSLEMEHERDPRAMSLEQDYLVRISHVCHTGLEKAYDLIKTLLVHEDRMTKNLELLKGAVLSESVMMRLGESLGRNEAHHKVNTLVRRAIAEDRPLLDFLLEDEQVTALISPQELRQLLNPANYLGSAGYFVDQSVALPFGAKEECFGVQ